MAAPMEQNLVHLIVEKEKLCLQNRKHINNIVDIISHIHSNRQDVVTTCITSLQTIFERFIISEEMCSSSDGADGDSAESEYRVWLKKQYTLTVAAMLSKLEDSDKNIQKMSMCALMKYVAGESRHPIKKKSSTPVFPESLFAEIVSQMISPSQNTAALIDIFQEFLRFDDIRYQTLKCLLRDLEKKDASEVYLSNIFCLLDKCSSRKCRSKFLAMDTAGKMGSPKEHTKLFTSTWLQFIAQNLSPSLYKKVLVILKDKVMPRLSNPLVLSDFLTESYNVGGVISLLALDGLFLLINKYNLEYPEFYEKLYALLEPAVLHVKYRSRFFHLADLFLSSTHLPSYLVAAFAKKISRISLTAPSSVLPVTITFVLNLLKRHPSCKILINRPDGPEDLEEDPYRYDEADPAKCDAIKSSLWEIKSLQSHYCPRVSTLAERINNPLHKTEDMISDFLDITEEDLMEREIKKRRKTIPVTFEPPKGLMDTKCDKLKMHWTLE